MLTHNFIFPGYKKEIMVDRERSRSRSRSRDREHFSESVWDRSEVEGPPSTGNDRIERERERERREYEKVQLMREKESNKVYQPASRAEKDKQRQKSSPTTSTPTFKTHMQQKAAAMERRERSPKLQSFQQTPQQHMSQHMVKTVSKHERDELDDVISKVPSPVIPAPVPAPPALKNSAAACLTYNRVPWKLRVRKEVFRPTEPIGPPVALDLLFAQVASDVLGLTSTLRISADERRSAMNLLNSHNVTAENIRGQIRAIVKRHLVDMARDWPIYFARLFLVSGSPQLQDVKMIAVSHNGICLAKRDQDEVAVIKSFSFTELHSVVTLPRPFALQFSFRNGNRLTFYVPKAQAVQTMVQQYLQEYRQVSELSFNFFSQVFLIFIFKLFISSKVAKTNSTFFVSIFIHYRHTPFSSYSMQSH